MSVDSGAEVERVEVLRLGVGSSVVLGAEFTHPCFSSALEVLLDLALGFPECVELLFHVVRIPSLLGFAIESCVIVQLAIAMT